MVYREGRVIGDMKLGFVSGQDEWKGRNAFLGRTHLVLFGGMRNWSLRRNGASLFI